MGSRVPSWSDLPQELIGKIGKLLDTPIDIQKFREVCRSWLSSCPRSYKLLSLLFPLQIPAPLNDGCFSPQVRLVVVASNIYVLHPQQDEGPQNLSVPWIVRVEELNPGFLQVRRILCHRGDGAPEVWRIPVPEDFPLSLDLSGITSKVAKVTEVFKGYNLSKVITIYSPHNEVLDLGINKVVLHFDSHGESPATVGNFTIVVLFFVGRLYVVRLSDYYWNPIKFRRVSKFDDIISFRGKVFVIDRKGRLYKVSCKTLSCVCIVHDPPYNTLVAETRKYLVELCGELYIICYCKTSFRVFQLNKGRRKWTEIYTLGEDVVIFLKPGCCFSTSAKDFPNWDGNKIVYHVNSFRPYRRAAQAFNDMHFQSDQSFYFDVYHMGGGSNISLKTYTDVFWPPPSWIRYIRPDSRPMATTSLEMLLQEAVDTNGSIEYEKDFKAPA